MKKKRFELPSCGMLVGSPVYMDRGDYVFQHTGPYYTSWVSEDHDMYWYLERIVSENQGNLVVVWDGGATGRCLQAAADWRALEDVGIHVAAPDWAGKKNLVPSDDPRIEQNREREGAGFLKFVEKSSEYGLYSYGIYSEAAPEYAKKLSAMPLFMGYNTGEKFSFDIEQDDEDEVFFREKKVKVKPGVDLETFTTAFQNSVKNFIAEKQKCGWERFLITAASFHLDMEVMAAGNNVIPHLECFAFQNINFASSLCRGLYKQFSLPAWGNYLAHEHYSFLPYSSPYKFKMLDAAFYLSYMNGSKITLLESGNWFLQSDHVEDSPMHDVPKVHSRGTHWNAPHEYAHLVPKAREHYSKLNYDSQLCRKYRKSLSDFYDFLKKNGTPKGQPEITIAALKGRFDLCGASYSPNCAVGGQYQNAELNPRWYEAAPERTWEVFRCVFFPLNNTLGEYVNSYFSGTPFGMTDIVSLADENLTAKYLLDNYKVLICAGWNTADERQYSLLREYAEGGGTLFLSIAHLSKNKDRNFTTYSTDELVNGGDFSDLCGVKVKRRGRQIYWILAAENNSLGFERFHHFGPCYTHMAEIELTAPVDIPLIHDETFEPILTVHSIGKGKVYFLNMWEYPGAMDTQKGPGARLDSPGVAGEIFRFLAERERGTFYITDDGIRTGSECSFITWSYFPSDGTLCLMNADFTRPHKFFIHRNGLAEECLLEKGEFKILDSSPV